MIKPFIAHSLLVLPFLLFLFLLNFVISK